MSFLSISSLFTIDNIASILCLSSVFFIIKNNILGWPLGFIGSMMMILFYFEQKIFGQMGLFIFFSVMQLNSWKSWIVARKNLKNNSHVTSTVNDDQSTNFNSSENWQRLTLKKFVTVYVPLILVATVIIGFILYQLKPEQSSKQLLLDSFTSAASLFAQYLMGKKVVECWLLWNVVNLATVIFSIEYTTINIAILYGAYMISATFGYIEWLKNWKATHENH